MHPRSGYVLIQKDILYIYISFLLQHLFQELSFFFRLFLYGRLLSHHFFYVVLRLLRLTLSRLDDGVIDAETAVGEVGHASVLEGPGKTGIVDSADRTGFDVAAVAQTGHHTECAPVRWCTNHQTRQKTQQNEEHPCGIHDVGCCWWNNKQQQQQQQKENNYLRAVVLDHPADR